MWQDNLNQRNDNRNQRQERQRHADWAAHGIPHLFLCVWCHMPLIEAHEDIEYISNYRAVNQRSRRRQKEVEQADQTVPVVNRQIQQKCYDSYIDAGFLVDVHVWFPPWITRCHRNSCWRRCAPFARSGIARPSRCQSTFSAVHRAGVPTSGIPPPRIQGS